jgi:hypothetical protein
MKYNLFLDDIRHPYDCISYMKDPGIYAKLEWVIVRNYDEFVAHIRMRGLENYEVISLDHDLGDTAMNEYSNNVSPNYELNYDNIKEKTGYDAIKFLVALFHNTNEERFNMSRSERKANTWLQIALMRKISPLLLKNWNL